MSRNTKEQFLWRLRAPGGGKHRQTKAETLAAQEDAKLRRAGRERITERQNIDHHLEQFAKGQS